MAEGGDADSVPPAPRLVRAGDLHLCIRPVTPADRESIREGLRAISPETTYQRFFVSAFSPSEQELQYLTEVDGIDHVALGALDCTQSPPQGTGIARYVRLPDDPTRAEAAIVVIDAYQGRGIGSLLLAALNTRAAQCGVEYFRSYVLVDNRGVVKVLRALGAIEAPVQEGILQLDVPVYAGPEDVPAAPALDRLRWAWRALDAATEGRCDGEVDRR